VPAAPRRLLTRVLLAAVLGVGAALAVACGSSGGGKGLLSRAESRTIMSALNGISAGVRHHSCARVRAGVQALDNALSHLSSGTSTKLVQNLGHGATTVKQLAQSQCARPQKTTTSSSSTSTSTTTSTTPTTTSTTQTGTTTSTPTTGSTPTTDSNPQTTATAPAAPTPGKGKGKGKGPGNGPGKGKGDGGGAGLGGGGPQ
jgi:hypothetical protein